MTATFIPPGDQDTDVTEVEIKKIASTASTAVNIVCTLIYTYTVMQPIHNINWILCYGVVM